MIYSSKWQIILRNGVIFLEEPFWSKLIQLPVSKMDTKASSSVALVLNFPLAHITSNRVYTTNNINDINDD